MKEATLIYPHQLFASSPVLKRERATYLVEEPLLLTHNPVHRQKLIFHKLSLDAYEARLRREGFQVTRLRIQDFPRTEPIFGHLRNEGVQRIHVMDTTDDFLEKALAASGLDRVWYESPLFLLEKSAAVEHYKGSGRFMARFYKTLRREKDILIGDDGEPAGGRWSFDEENRKKLPRNQALPADITFSRDPAVAAAEAWVEELPVRKYGQGGCWLPWDQEGAHQLLTDFLTERFALFGPYEDAISTRGQRLFHSTLSPLMNVGLLTPGEVLEGALHKARQEGIPLASLEGFVRQILGWREFIRAAYEVDHVRMRTRNFWNHQRSLPEAFWTGETGLVPVDHVIRKVLETGFAHHIERLMVMGNIMLLSEIHPDQVYHWFMALHVDAYDWVMVPNVYAMSQFADGGLFATKPYISGANYLRKMSDFPRGDWEDIWTALYWRFIADNLDFFEQNPRLAMMSRLWKKMAPPIREKHRKLAEGYFRKIVPGPWFDGAGPGLG